MTAEVKRISVIFPVRVLEDLRRLVPPKERSKFIAEATERELKRLRLEKALRESAGAWSDEDHPDLMTVEDVNRYIRRLRETSMPRTWDEIIAEAEQNG
ncbi:MAG: hypothetical protein DRI61_04440 [Chloroflexi bacterium]|nr:MAG: hypothetical protein DRI61_04440 [Chloroflexota bacterium]HDN79259.1 hypothetical protein [Chloroflexota bacterium]